MQSLDLPSLKRHMTLSEQIDVLKYVYGVIANMTDEDYGFVGDSIVSLRHRRRWTQDRPIEWPDKHVWSQAVFATIHGDRKYDLAKNNDAYDLWQSLRLWRDCENRQQMLAILTLAIDYLYGGEQLPGQRLLGYER